MSDTGNGALTGRRVLVVEDEFYLAEDLSRALGEAGADVAGPANTVRKARALIDEKKTVDLAVLDIDLNGELIFPLASELRRRNVPFVFTTGYDEVMIPTEHEAVERWAKPLATIKLVQRLSKF